MKWKSKEKSDVRWFGEELKRIVLERRLTAEVMPSPKGGERPVASGRATNWLAEYSSRVRRDRVKWNTKLYARRASFDAKELHEQIDELIDITAKEFANWLNTLSNEQSEFCAKTAKQLFSIDVDSEISRSIAIDLQQRPAVDSTLAAVFQCPEVSVRNTSSSEIAKRNIFFFSYSGVRRPRSREFSRKFRRKMRKAPKRRQRKITFQRIYHTISNLAR